jgi:hypothetical protein
MAWISVSCSRASPSKGHEAVRFQNPTHRTRQARVCDAGDRCPVPTLLSRSEEYCERQVRGILRPQGRSRRMIVMRRNRTLGHPWVNESDRPEAALGDECGDRPRWVRSLAAGGGSGNGGSGCWAPRRLRSTMMPLWLLVWRGLPCWISGLTSVKWLTRSGGLLAPFRPPPSLAQSRSLVFLGDLVHAGWTGASVKPVF